jgi:hypothetical protein
MTVPSWVTRGKSIRQLIQELSSFEDQELEVRISLDEGDTHRCVSLVVKKDGCCVLMNCEPPGPPLRPPLGRDLAPARRAGTPRGRRPGTRSARR